MREVLSLTYNAAAHAVLVTVAATHESENEPGTMVRLLGAPEPQATFPVNELPPEHQAALSNMLTYLLDETEAHHARAFSDPAVLAARASAIAKAEFDLQAKRTAALDELASLEAEIERRKSALVQTKNVTPG